MLFLYTVVVVILLLILCLSSSSSSASASMLLLHSSIWHFMLLPQVNVTTYTLNTPSSSSFSSPSAMNTIVVSTTAETIIHRALLLFHSSIHLVISTAADGSGTPSSFYRSCYIVSTATTSLVYIRASATAVRVVRVLLYKQYHPHFSIYSVVFGVDGDVLFICCICRFPLLLRIFFSKSYKWSKVKDDDDNIVQCEWIVCCFI